MAYRKKITCKKLSNSYVYESLNQELIEKEKIIKNLEHENNYYYEFYNDALSSISFKITYPLRVINSYLIKAKKVKFEVLKKKNYKKKN